jgi:hypothetical protein
VLSAEGADPQPAPKLDLASETATVDGTTLTAVAVDSDTGTGF